MNPALEATTPISAPSQPQPRISADTAVDDCAPGIPSPTAQALRLAGSLQAMGTPMLPALSIPRPAQSCSAAKTQPGYFAGFPLPVLVAPQADSNNPLLRASAAVLGTASAPIIELTLVWADEDHPNSLTDGIYDFVREHLIWGRREDIETVFLHYSRLPGGQAVLEKIEFPGVYSGEQSFQSAEHRSATVPSAQIEFEGRRPVLYINTWNHMFGVTDNNSGEKTVYRSYTVTRGSRQQVENKTSLPQTPVYPHKPTP